MSDLLRSDFKMQAGDKDFDLTHEQLIKVVKVILYKQNLFGKKSEYERGEIASMINEQVAAVEDLTMSNFKEVSTFLHEVHSDLESYIDRHKKEHANLNMKVQKPNEDLTNVIGDLKEQ